MLQGFLLKLLVEASKNPEIRDFVSDQVIRLAKALKDDLLPDVVGTFPAFGASLLKTAFEKLPNVADIPGEAMDLAADSVKKIVDNDPDIPGLSDLFDLSEWAKRLVQVGKP